MPTSVTFMMPSQRQVRFGLSMGN